jgi:hypothetical protein
MQSVKLNAGQAGQQLPDDATLRHQILERLIMDIDVAFQHDAIIDDGRYFIDHLGGSETGIRDHGDTDFTVPELPVMRLVYNIIRICG